VLFHLEYHRQGRWEAFGSGEGRGEEASIEALRDLLRLAGGALPAGTYRCIAADSSSTRWESLRLDLDGRVSIADAEPVAAEATTRAG
jgi:hypothetical protein